MFKCIFNNSYKVFLVLPAFAFFFTMSSCSSIHSEELAHLSALQDSLQHNQENLAMDVTIFSYRAKYIDSVLLVFHNKYTDSMDLDLGSNLSRYKSIRKVYKHHTGVYNSNVKEQEALKNQLANLEKDLKAGKLTKETFKSYFAAEKLDVEKLTNSSALCKQTLYEVEPDYVRITKYLQPFLVNLK
jgi:hypothetical protein